MSGDPSDNRAWIVMTAASNVATVGGAVQILRDIAELMHAASEDDAPIETGVVSGWVSRLDFIGNAISDQNDKLIEALRGGGFPTVVCDGSIVERAVPFSAKERVQA